MAKISQLKAENDALRRQVLRLEAELAKLKQPRKATKAPAQGA